MVFVFLWVTSLSMIISGSIRVFVSLIQFSSVSQSCLTLCKPMREKVKQLTVMLAAWGRKERFQGSYWNNHWLSGWWMDWWLAVPTASSQHHGASSLNSSWLSRSGILLIHETKSCWHERGDCLLAARSSPEHLLHVQTETQKNRKSSSDMWAFGPLAGAFFPSKINEAQRCQLFPFNSPQ